MCFMKINENGKKMNKRPRMERCVCEKQQRWHYVLVHHLVLEYHSRTKRTKSKKKIQENVYYIGGNTTILLEKTMLLKCWDALLELDQVFVKQQDSSATVSLKSLSLQFCLPSPSCLSFPPALLPPEDLQQDYSYPHRCQSFFSSGSWQRSLLARKRVSQLLWRNTSQMLTVVAQSTFDLPCRVSLRILNPVIRNILCGTLSLQSQRMQS